MAAQSTAFDELTRPGGHSRYQENSAASYRFSRAIWNIDWHEHFPRVITDDGIVVNYVTFDRVLPFLGAELADIFEEAAEDDRFVKTEMTPAKVRYYRQCADVFEIVDAGQTVGVLVCTPIDWSTYYLRLAAVLPAYHGRKLPQRVFPLLFEVLASAGVQRIEAETSPSNLAVVQNMTRMRFNVTGSVLTERWGALLRLTKFLDRRCEDTFLTQFCSGIRYQHRRAQSTPSTQEGGSNEEEIRSYVAVIDPINARIKGSAPPTSCE